MFNYIIRYVVVCGIEEASATDRTLDPGDEFEENHLTSSTFFLINYCRSSTLPVSQNLSNLVLITCSVGVFLPKSLCNFRFTTVPDSNLAMSKTILILISIRQRDILCEIHSTKL